MTGPLLVVFKAPEDPKQKEDWTRHMVRLQIAMWVDDGAICSYCQKPYASVDDFLSRNPKGGYDGNQFVDSACWYEYIEIKGKRE